ncbi:hypothetical protein MRX96_036942 [Rhipicephalus microplus]
MRPLTTPARDEMSGAPPAQPRAPRRYTVEVYHSSPCSHGCSAATDEVMKDEPPAERSGGTKQIRTYVYTLRMTSSCHPCRDQRAADGATSRHQRACEFAPVGQTRFAAEQVHAALVYLWHSVRTTVVSEWFAMLPSGHDKGGQLARSDRQLLQRPYTRVHGYASGDIVQAHLYDRRGRGTTKVGDVSGRGAENDARGIDEGEGQFRGR